MILRFYPVFLVALIYISGNGFVFGNDNIEGTQSFYFENISVQQGLPHSNVRSFYQDSKGFMWIGTGNGLARYNGNDFTVFNSDFLNANSLPGNTVIRLMGDSINGIDGIWVVTNDNLAWFNLETKQFLRVSSRGIPWRVFDYNNIVDIFESSEGDAYLLARNGIYSINRNSFTLHETNFPFHRANLSYSSVATHDNMVFLGTSEGLVTYDHATGYFQTFNRPGNAHPLVSFTQPSSLLAVSRNVVFLGTQNGLLKFDIATETLTLILKPHPIRHMGIRDLYIDDDKNKLWIPTMGHGVFVFDIPNAVLQAVVCRRTGAFHNSHCIYIDSQHVLWIGHFQGGFSKAELFEKQFFNLDVPPGSANRIYSLESLGRGNILLGNNLGQIFVFNHQDQSLGKLFSDEENRFYAPTNTITGAFFYDRVSRKVWMGNFSRGLKIADVTFGNDDRIRLHNLQHITPETSDVAILKGWSVRSIAKDDDGMVWVATLDGGISIFTPNGKNHPNDHINEALQMFFTRGIRHILNPEHEWDNTMIISDHTGMHIMDTRTGVKVALEELMEDSRFREAFSNPVWSVYQQDERIFWLATANTGLVRLELEDRRNEFNNAGKPYTVSSVRIFHLSEGFPSNLLYKILPAGKSHIWLSSEIGLIRFNINDYSFELYNQHNGLQQLEFHFGAATIDPETGFLFFGGSGGVTWFHPDAIVPDTIAPYPVITGAGLFAKPILPGDTLHHRFVLKKDIPYSDTLIFRYSQNVLTFNLAALKFAGFSGNRTAYRLEGFDREWRFTGSGFETVTYTNLNPGVYTLIVRAINSDNIWSQMEDSLHIRILPPWWQTPQARISWVLIALALTYWLIHTVKVRERMRSKIKFQSIEIEKERAIARKTHELDQIRINFFTNISHEFRTPLTLILGPLDVLLKSIDPRDAIGCQLDMMRRNALRLLHLINQLLDMQKIEKESLNLRLVEDDFVMFTEKIFQSFTQLAQNKKIDYTFHPFSNSFVTPFDPDVMEKVLFNLLSNAFKFTPENGKVKVCVYLESGKNNDENIIRLTIADSGPGIPASEKENIFRRFYRYEQRNTFTATGTGIGLALSRQLAELHKGTLEETGTAGKGAIFNLTFPATAYAYAGEEFISGKARSSNEINYNGQLLTVPFTTQPFEKQIKESDKKDAGNKSTILVIDDNPDILEFLKSILNETLDLLFASDGIQGLEMAREHNPALIISDVSMPHMDGLEMASILKGDYQTSHIPIIMLTSRNTQDQELAGLQHGADDYLAKPFNKDILLARINNVFSAREKWFTRASKELDFTAPDIMIVDQDKKFLEKLRKTVQENIAETGFTTELLAQKMGVSRTLLFKKIKGLLNETGSGFILSVRMKSAAEYLRKSDLNVSEICYSTGFSDPKYFTKVFKKYFGLTPKEYRNSHVSES